MRWRIRQFLAIAWLAALETIRQPVVLLVSTAGILMTGLLPLIVTQTLGEGERMTRDSGLALCFVCGLILGSYAACSSLTHEIRRGTAASVLSKPVGRSLFFLAKFAGIAAVMALFCAAFALALLLSTRMAAQSFVFDWWAGGPLLAAPVLAYALAALVNFFTRRPFVSNAFALLLLALLAAFAGAGLVDAEGRRAAFGAAYTWTTLPAVALIALAVLVLTAIAVSLATRLDIVPTLSICSVLFLVGLMSDFLFGQHAAASAAAAAAWFILPNWQHFWVTDALAGGGTIPWSYVGRVAVYAALYLAGTLGLGMLAFQRMEVKA